MEQTEAFINLEENGFLSKVGRRRIFFETIFLLRIIFLSRTYGKIFSRTFESKTIFSMTTLEEKIILLGKFQLKTIFFPALPSSSTFYGDFDKSSGIMQKRGRKVRNIAVVMIIFISTHKRQKMAIFYRL